MDCAELILKEPEDGSRSFFLHPAREGSGANECDDRSAVPDLPGDHYDPVVVQVVVHIMVQKK
ncbi:hypothetical protein JIR001_28520 [Polycladomyces abyssicola]|uniref:Uncharacterized protein n=1 Tax=Polycladomyces abyssicola TaxID=1125966 RepID=A0A8D5ZM05_9BACL|nr:hypothetical protein JIR001_28520 [Polycladomyces abyssicola]